jgi:hypothetical protein
VVSGQHLVSQTSWPPGPGWASLPFLPPIRQPALILAGTDDPSIPQVHAG